MKKYLVAAAMAVLPFTVGANCLGNFDAPVDDHFAYWQTVDGQLWRTRYDECVITIRDLSYHHTDEEALACGDAQQVVETMYKFLFIPTLFNFDFDKANVDADGLRVLTEIANGLDALNDVRILFVGHTDAVGTVEYNLGLGMRRAENAAAVLTALLDRLNIGNVRIRTNTLGESDLLVNTQARERANRRVAILIEWFSKNVVIVR